MGVIISMMGSALTCVATSLTFCFCSACGSLCGSCLGNDKPSTAPPSITSGRKRSVLLLLLSLTCAFALQYAVAPAIVSEYKDYLDMNSAGRYLYDSWKGGCDYDDEDSIRVCSGNSGALRASFASFLFFILAAITAKCKPTANRDAWVAKYVLFLFLVAATIFIPNAPYFYDIYLNIARIGASFFIVYQQIIFIDMAYNWNESWVEKANEAELEETGSGRKWLSAILVSCGVLFIGSFTIIGLLYHFFQGCVTNIAFISVTLVLIILVTIAQLLSHEGSLLTSAVVSAYSSYLVYTAVSKNPNEACNPAVNDVNILNIVIGVVFTLASIIWAGWSSTAGNKLGSSGEIESNDAYVNSDEARSSNVTGVVLNSNANGQEDSENLQGASTWMINIILALISCWFGMALTSWGSISSGGTVVNPTVGKVSMWMIMAWQWLALCLYLWTLVAPKIFPDRDFS